MPLISVASISTYDVPSDNVIGRLKLAVVPRSTPLYKVVNTPKIKVFLESEYIVAVISVLELSLQVPEIYTPDPSFDVNGLAFAAVDAFVNSDAGVKVGTILSFMLAIYKIASFILSALLSAGVFPNSSHISYIASTSLPVLKGITVSAPPTLYPQLPLSS